MQQLPHVFFWKPQKRLRSILGTSVGPVIATSLRAFFGSFNEVFLLFTLLPLVSGTLVLLFARKPRPPKGRRR